MTVDIVRRLFVASLVCGAATAATAALAQGPLQIATPPVWRGPTLQVSGAEQPVRLEALRLDVEVAGGMAQTRVQMEFFNPNPRVLEGKLQFPLAPGQVVSGFALDIDGRLRDAVPVDKVRATQVFEDIARRSVDPGLLQTTLGNNYELRVYPLAPGKTRTVVLTIVEPAAARLSVPLAYAGRVGRFALSLHAPTATRAPVLSGASTLGLSFERDGDGGFVARTTRTDTALPSEPLVVELPGDSARRPEITTEERDGESWFSVALPVVMRSAARQLPRHVQIVWDTSGSATARHVDRELALLDAYFARARDTSVSLLRVSDVAAPPQRFEVRDGDWQALRRAIEAISYDGASNLGAVRHDGVADEVLWFSDGLANYGKPWRLAFPVPVYTVNSAAGSDPAALQALADATGGRFIDLGTSSRAAASAALLESGTVLAGLQAVGATDLVAQSQSVAAGRLVFAGRLTAPSADIVVRLRDSAGRITTQIVKVSARQNPSRLAALQWARLALASLAGEAETNRARIRGIGQRFGLATGETSLIVLERVDDYVRHEIEPPAELRPAYDRLLASATRQRRQTDAARLAQLAQRFDARIAWWQRDFPKGTPPAPIAIATTQPAGVRRDAMVALDDASPATARRRVETSEPRSEALAGAARGNAMALPSPAPTAPPGNARPSLAKQQGGDAERGATSISIALTPAANGSAAIKRLQAARPEDRLRVYFDERRDNAANVGFFLDAAEFFIGHEQRAVGLRVLSNLAELDLQNRQVLRLLAYRLQQAGELDLALPIFERVLVLAPNEPQSHRDLGLALAEAGQAQAAIDRLYEVVSGSWDARFADIDLIALTELNAVLDKAQRSGTRIDVTRIDPRLLKHLPLALRVVLAWDADNTDVDLHVIDPNGEEVFYSHPLSYQGGAITHDATGGYGPEEFALRVAKPGTYRVEANFFGHRQQVLTTSTGLMLTLSSGFGTVAQQDRRTTRSVRSASGERVVVGEFEVK